MSPATSFHPFLHPDLLPIILSYATDVDLARLMRVCRTVLAEIVEQRWPMMTLDPRPAAATRPMRSRGYLPYNTHRLSEPTQYLLARYCRTVEIRPHAAYVCPPRAIPSHQPPMARTVQIGRIGLCRQDSSLSASMTSHDQCCQIMQVYNPTTIRIGGHDTNPILAPFGIYLAQTVRRLLLCIDPNQVNADRNRFHKTINPEDHLLHQIVPDQVEEIVFLLATPPSPEPNSMSKEDGTRGNVSQLDGTETPAEKLCKSIAAWVQEGHRVEKRAWIIVGAEMFGSTRKAKNGGAATLDMSPMLEREVEKAVGALGIGGRIWARIEFVTMEAYLRSSQTRSEMSQFEIAEMVQNERWRQEEARKQRRQSRKDAVGRRATAA